MLLFTWTGSQSSKINVIRQLIIRYLIIQQGKFQVGKQEIQENTIQIPYNNEQHCIHTHYTFLCNVSIFCTSTLLIAFLDKDFTATRYKISREFLHKYFTDSSLLQIAMDSVINKQTSTSKTRTLWVPYVRKPLLESVAKLPSAVG